MLSDMPIWIFILLVLIVFITRVLTNKWTTGLLLGYVLIILAETLLLRKSFEGRHFQPQLFWSYKVWNVQKRQIIANILMFIPLGLITGSLWKWKGIIAGIGLSLTIELLQLVSRRGLFEFDDIVHNTLGTFIGVSIYVLFEAVVKKKGSNNGFHK